jgi:hypothetical protein
MNSEIIGLPTQSDYGVVFARNVEEMLLDSSKGIEAVDFKKGGEAESDKPGYVPITIQLQFKRGVDMSEQEADNFIGREMKNAFLRYKSLSEHIYQDGQKPLTYKLYKERGVQYADVYALGIPRHPAQLYESIYCLFIFLMLLHIWYHHRHQFADGFIFSIMMIVLWSARFVDEMFKENQVPFEDALPLNMGQLLSLPMIAVGVVMLIFTLKKGKPQQAG